MDPPTQHLAVTDPALFASWRAAVTRLHAAGGTSMTLEKVASLERESAVTPDPAA